MSQLTTSEACAPTGLRVENYCAVMMRLKALAADDVERSDSWITQISYTMFCLLDGSGVEVAFDAEGELEA